MSTTIFNIVAEKQRKKTAFWAVLLVSEGYEYSLGLKAAQKPGYGVALENWAPLFDCFF
jgi:hypothetical protein